LFVGTLVVLAPFSPPDVPTFSERAIAQKQLLVASVSSYYFLASSSLVNNTTLTLVIISFTLIPEVAFVDIAHRFGESQATKCRRGTVNEAAKNSEEAFFLMIERTKTIILKMNNKQLARPAQ
jgi:hypothetical protein